MPYKRCFSPWLSCGVVLFLLQSVSTVDLGDCPEARDQVSLLQVETVKVSPIKIDLGAVEASTSTRKQPVLLLHLHVPYNEISLDIPYKTLWEEAWTFPERKPFYFNVFLATLKTWLADVVVQFLQVPQDREWSFDWRRSFAFASFGCLYVGIAQWVLYVTILTSLFPGAVMFANEPWHMKMKDGTGQMDVVGQIVVDNFVFNVFIYFPAFYMIKAVVQEEKSIPSRLYSGLLKYWKNAWVDNFASWCIWILADLVIFACPMFLRMPLEHSVSFGWTMFISFMRGRADARGDKTPRKADKEKAQNFDKPEKEKAQNFDKPEKENGENFALAD